jgi:hypothetical protein
MMLDLARALEQNECFSCSGHYCLRICLETSYKDSAGRRNETAVTIIGCKSTTN